MTLLRILVLVFVLVLLVTLLTGGGLNVVHECSKPVSEMPGWCLLVLHL